MMVDMHTLTSRNDSDTRVLTTENPVGQYLSIRDIVEKHQDHVGVYMIKPGGVLPKCQPKEMKH